MVEGIRLKTLFLVLHGTISHINARQGFCSSVFCRGLIDGASTLELDNGITKVTSLHYSCMWWIRMELQDGVVVVWHDENITPQKCRDTVPVVSCPSLTVVRCLNVLFYSTSTDPE